MVNSLCYREAVNESILQAEMIRKLNRAGWLAYKWTSPGRKGVPDLIAFAPGGRAIALEVKTPTGRLSPHQVRMIARLNEHGVPTYVVKSMDELENIICTHSQIDLTAV